MSTTPFPGVAMAWGIWGCALVLMIPGFTHLAVAGTLIVSVALTWWIQPGPLRGPSTGLVTTTLMLLALWLLLGVIQQRQSLDGQILWILPEFDSDSGSTLGGPVRTGQLLFALENGLTAAGLCAAAGLLLRVVTLPEWNTFLRLVLGRGAAVVTPTLMLAAVRAEESEARGARRSHRIDLTEGTWGASMRTALARVDAGERIEATVRRSRFGWIRVPVALALVVALSTRAVVPGSERGPVLLMCAFGVLTLLGCVLWRGARPVWSARAFAPLLGAAALAGAAKFGGVSDPLLLSCAVAVLPAATVFIWEKKA